jgi:transketolase
MEGVSQEAIGLAGKLQLSRLIVLWDNNGITIDGKVSLSDVTDQKARFAASGWDVFECDGHDPADIDRALTAAKASPRPAHGGLQPRISPSATRRRTPQGPRRPDRQGADADGEGRLRLDLGPFEVPADVKTWWESLGTKGAKARQSGRRGLPPCHPPGRPNSPASMRWRPRPSWPPPFAR